MKTQELIEQIKVHADKLTYAMDHGLEESEAEIILALCAPYYQQVAKNAVKEQPRCMCDDAGLTARIDFLDTLQAIDEAFKE